MKVKKTSTMTSLELAEISNKTHEQIIKDIEEEIINLKGVDDTLFKKVSYIDTEENRKKMDEIIKEKQKKRNRIKNKKIKTKHTRKLKKLHKRSKIYNIKRTYFRS